MAINDVIPRDFPVVTAAEEETGGHGFPEEIRASRMLGIGEPADPEAQTVFEQFGCAISTNIHVSGRNVFLNGGEEKDHNLNLLINEITELNQGQGTPPTPDAVVPDRVFFLRGFSDENLPIPGLDLAIPPELGQGGTIKVWPFEDTGPNAGPITFPSAPIRAVEGEVVHTVMTAANGTHTIHHHAIEPTALNDGVGHISFEVQGGEYAYQWLAAEAGTYFYHCHKNTVLHFEMGMYGPLLIDPPAPGAPFPLGGPGKIRRMNEIIDYDIEAVWFTDDFDPEWRTLGRDLGLVCPFANTDGQPRDFDLAVDIPPVPNFHSFNPTIFLISGVAHPWTLLDEPELRANMGDTVLAAIPVRAQKGQAVIIRLGNASYTTQRITLGVPSEVIEVDGRTLGRSEKFMRYSRPFTVAPNTSFTLTIARRWVLLINTATIAAGTYPVTIDYFHWVTGDFLGTAQTEITII